MANGSSRVLAVILSLIVGFAAGWLLHTRPQAPAPPPRPLQAQNWNIKVGPDPCDLTDDDQNGKKAYVQWISRGKHSIRWHSPGSENLYIVLHVPTCQKAPFPNWPKVGRDAQGRDLYVIGDGKTSRIDSGVVAADTCPSDPNDPKTWIKYDQFLQVAGQGVFLTCDGMIIIDP